MSQAYCQGDIIIEMKGTKMKQRLNMSETEISPDQALSGRGIPKFLYP